MSPQYLELLDLITRVQGMRAALVVGDSDGLVVAESVMEGVKSAAVAALATSLAARLRRAAESAGRRAPSFIHLQASAGALLVAWGPSGLLLVALADPRVNLGLARVEMLRAVGQLG